MCDSKYSDKILKLSFSANPWPLSQELSIISNMALRNKMLLMLKYKRSALAEKAKGKEDDCVEIAWVFSNSRAVQKRADSTEAWV